MTRHLLIIAAGCAVLLSGCADDRSQIESKINNELAACKKASGPVHEIRFETGKPYPVQTFACSEPISDITITEQIRGSAAVGPYQFKLQKNTSDARWHITQVTWPDLDQARALMERENKADSDIAQAIKLFTTIEDVAPRFEEPRMSHLKLLLMQRRSFNKQNEPQADRSGLGAAQAWYDKALADAAVAEQKNLAASLRLEVIAYFDDFRQRAEESSVPSDSAAEWEEAAIKAVRKDADDAKKKGDKVVYANAMAEIETREKEARENAVQRENDAKVMAAIAADLKKRECAEIQAALGISDIEAELKTSLDNYKGSAGCP